jgi:DNA-binding response OmpR family regulator
LPRRATRSSSPRSLIVLDGEGEASLLSFGLREGGFRVRAAATVDEVLALADSDRIDALVVNAAHPDLAGERAAKLRAFARKRAIAIVAVGGDASVGPRLGAAAMVPKPGLATDVIAVLERLRPPRR